MTTAPPRVRLLGDSDFETFQRTVNSAFLTAPTDEAVALDRVLFGNGHFHGAFDGNEMIGGAGIVPKSMTMPGTGSRAVAAVVAVATAPGNRRRGVLTSLMRAQLEGLHNEAAEPITALWCSEASIYGRFGYGSASMRLFTSVPRGSAFVSTVDCGGERVRELPRQDAFVAMKEIYARVAPKRIGWIGRTDYEWERWYLDDGTTTPLRFAVHPGAYAAYRVQANVTLRGPRHRVDAHEIVSVDPVAHAAIWRHLLDIDLTGEVTYNNMAVDDPLPHMLVDRRAAERRVGDGLWIRLVDVDRALVGRRYSVPADLVLELTDTFCPWNAGRWRFTVDGDGVARVRRTDDDADLAMGVEELGALFLGGTAPSELAGAGRISELRPGALVTLALTFSTERLPHCAEMF
ncbi:GNAT family N-acetyltransferase [Allokutzneria sp. A3M-2-11 16]|uniref:GNAT family N-acetyltransferase n=1 Tax=Allokutzneria sp. A3M-2-11 16 TaxID=2962043 RepID=UPI0020B81F01|nr:GNAT family N-acetyltransferase [Allokutzneria sp. A3M-2-11 16]MCP3800916.1 GNAT family N-acetyltransferase [Allokutzneria sp. A3M-2-11 16]